MPAWLYVCKSCGSTHEAPLRPGGTVYLRCLTTREWSWYEPTVFTLPGRPGVRAGASRGGASRQRTAAARARGASQNVRSGSGTARAGRRPAAARATRKAVARRVPRGGRKKRR